jgi:hypothetical protein
MKGVVEASSMTTMNSSRNLGRRLVIVRLHPVQAPDDG